MATIAEWVKIDGERVLQSLQEAYEKLGAADGELVLDFSAVRRIDGAALASLEKLASAAEARNVKLVVRAVSVEIYKVLKLARLAPHFTFLS